MTKRVKTNYKRLAKELMGTMGVKAPMTKITLLESGEEADAPTPHGITYLMFEFDGVEYQWNYNSVNGWKYIVYKDNNEPVEDNSEPQTVKVILKAFTGMVIGEYDANFIENANGYEITCKNGTLIGFDSDTLKEVTTDPKRARYAHSIQIVK